jgi:DNA-binding Lrp family transcriptional regulator
MNARRADVPVSLPAPGGALTEFERRLLNDFQRGLPLTETPFADMASQLGVAEQVVLDALDDLKHRGFITRVGAVFAPRRLGASTLAAMCVPGDRLDEVADLVSGYPEVNHNYEREHRFNLWFVVTAADEADVARVFDDIERRTGLPVMNLPLEQDYHIDLGFPLWC